MEDLSDWQIESFASAVIKKNRVLILGDGNFSFSLSFAQHSLGLQKTKDEPALKSSSPQKESECISSRRENGTVAQNSSLVLYATSYDSKEVVTKNEETLRNIKSLNEFENVIVLHSVDATNLLRTFHDSIKFRKVIFNFPHIGGKSNIRACRKLLEDSFRSISDVIDDDSDVLITLCRGQGGTPNDIHRNGYGNSWQVASQAAKSGLILSNVIRFSVIAPPGYVTAGYRGHLQHGFIKKEALTHVFKKGIKMSISLEGKLRCPSREIFIAKVNGLYLDALNSFNPFKSNRHTFSQCSSRLRSMFEAECKSPSFETTFQVEEDGKTPSFSDGINQQKSHIPICGDWNPFEVLLEATCKSEMQYISQIFVSSSFDVSPYCYPVYEEFAFLDRTSRFLTLKEFVCYLQLSFELAFEGCSLQVSWNTVQVSEDSGYEIVDKGTGAFDVSLVPNFLNDLPMDSWLNLKPEVTISRSIHDLDFDSRQKSSEQASSVQYAKIDFSSHTMNDRELKYFAKEKQELSFSCCFDNDWPTCTLKVNDITVGSAGICGFKKGKGTDAKNHIDFMAVFRTDLLSLAILQVNDIRLFWSIDESYQERLRQCMVNLGLRCNLPNPKVMYPLCYRHDLCFWVKEAESEDVLLAAIRHCCGDIVHSVKLLRILRHEESGLLSFCYRMIYSRCDGPLSQKESVELQNKLRLCLIDLNFDLR